MMSNVSYSAPTRIASDSGGYPACGIFPRSGLGRAFFCWGVANVVLALLPVFDLLGNSAEPGPTGMPITLFYCYAVFTLNCLMGLAYYATRGKAWIEMEEKRAGEELK